MHLLHEFDVNFAGFHGQINNELEDGHAPVNAIAVNDLKAERTNRSVNAQPQQCADRPVAWVASVIVEQPRC